MKRRLPRSLNVNGIDRAIRTDFRDILNIIMAFEDPELEDSEKVYVTLVVLFENFDSIPTDDYEAAFKAALEFIDHGVKSDDVRSPRVMDWEQDEPILYPAINKVAGFETRDAEYVHWWTFMGYYQEISEGIFSHVLNLRLKKSKGRKLEKWEQEFWNSNKAICVLKRKLTAEEQAEKDRINALLN